jgi:hypothetical protein
LRNTNKLRKSIHSKKRGMLTSGILLLHDNFRAHTAAHLRALFEHFNWKCLITLPTALPGITALQQ